MTFLREVQVKGQKEQKRIPMPGIEPGPPGWKPGILTTRPHRNLFKVVLYVVLNNTKCDRR